MIWLGCAPLVFYLLGIWVGYLHGKERGFEECRQKWLDSIWERIDQVVDQGVKR